MGAIGSMVRQSQVNQQQSQFNGQLAGGVRNGSINRDEFMSVAKFDQQTHELEGQYLKDGKLSPEEKRILDSRMGQSRQMMQTYSGGDFHPFTQGPQSQLDARIDNQLNRTYSGIRDGSLAGPGIFARDEGAKALDGIGNVSTAMGKGQINLPFGGHIHPNFNRMLDNSSQNISDMRHNWRSGPPSMMPDNHSWGPHFGGPGYGGNNFWGGRGEHSFPSPSPFNRPPFGQNPFSPFGMNPFSPFGQMGGMGMGMMGMGMGMMGMGMMGMGMMGMGMNFSMNFNMGM